MFSWLQLTLHILQILGKVIDLWREKDDSKIKAKTEALNEAVKATGESDARGITMALDKYNAVR